MLQHVLLQHVAEDVRRQAGLLQRAPVDADPEPVAGIPRPERRDLDALDLPAGERSERSQQEAERAADLQETTRRSEPPELAGEKERVAVVALPLAGVAGEAVRRARVEVVAPVQPVERFRRQPRPDLPEAAVAAPVYPDRPDAGQSDLDERNHPAGRAADVAGIGHAGA